MSSDYSKMNIQPDYSIHMNYNTEGLPLFIDREDIMDYPFGKTIPHWNAELEVIYVYEGTMKIVANGITHHVNVGDFCFIDAGCLHFFENTDGQNCKYYIGLLHEGLYFANKDMTMRFINPVFHCFTPSIIHLTKDSPFHQELHTATSEMYRIIQEQKNGYELLTVAKAYEILKILCDIQKYPYLKKDNVDRKTSIALKQMLDYIVRNYQNRITIDQLCEVAQISRNTCFRLFHDFMGDTPTNFITKYRLNQSLTLLKNSSISISGIASHSGFSHQSHFTQLFSKYFGQTPLQYRKENL